MAVFHNRRRAVCLSKGKEHMQCEFCGQASVVMAKTPGVIVGAVTYAENLYDGGAVRPLFALS